LHGYIKVTILEPGTSLRLASQEDRSRLGTQGGAVLCLPVLYPPSNYSMKFYYVYVLYNRGENFLYIGYSEDLKQRVISHNKGENKSTRAHLPLELIHYEAYRNMKDAKRREKYLKSNKGKTTLITMLKEFFTTNAQLGF
jgi:putative endonuclease